MYIGCSEQSYKTHNFRKKLWHHYFRTLEETLSLDYKEVLPTISRNDLVCFCYLCCLVFTSIVYNNDFKSKWWLGFLKERNFVWTDAQLWKWHMIWWAFTFLLSRYSSASSIITGTTIEITIIIINSIINTTNTIINIELKWKLMWVC